MCYHKRTYAMAMNKIKNAQDVLMVSTKPLTTSQNPLRTIIFMENHYLQNVLIPRYFRHNSTWMWCVSKCQSCFAWSCGVTIVLMRRAGDFDSCPIKNNWHFFVHIKHTTVYVDPWRTIRAKMLHQQSIMPVLSDWINVLLSWTEAHQNILEGSAMLLRS